MRRVDLPEILACDHAPNPKLVVAGRRVAAVKETKLIMQTFSPHRCVMGRIELQHIVWSYDWQLSLEAISRNSVEAQIGIEAIIDVLIDHVNISILIE
jgi:hypothetical protein